MKIAVPILNEAQISPHFGRSRAFLVFDIEAGAIRGRDLRPNLHGHQAHGAHAQGQHHGHDHGHGHHDHSGFTELLRDCEVVLSGGMGPGAFHALQAAGMKVCLLPPGSSKPEEAVALYLSGRLQESAAASCRGHVHA